MYFSIDYKFIFVYEASLSSREVGGGSNPLRGPSMSVAGCIKGVIFIPPNSNQWLLVLSRVILGLNSFIVEKMLTNHVKVAINFNIFSLNLYNFFYTCFF